MKLFNLHTHTCFSDGQNTPEEMVRAAIDLGFSKLGFSDHSYLHYDEPYCMAYERYDAYKEELRRLREKYAGTIEILTGIEQDYYSDYPAEGFDYIIGSVHSVEVNGEQVMIDFSGSRGVKLITDAADRFFGGDIYCIFERYYENLSRVVEVTHADIIGHFDIITKTREIGQFFDPQHPRYLAAWKKAADRLLSRNKIFEINVAPVLRGTRDFPHPAPDILAYLKAGGAKLIYSGDCHSVLRLRQFASYVKEELQ